MHLSHLKLINFKNHSEKEFDFDPNINCITGKNAVGKTNILDAIYYLSFTKSFLSGSDASSIKTGEAFFMLQGTYHTQPEDTQVTCSLKSGQKKMFKVNQTVVKKLSGHIGQIPLVITTPTDIGLILDGSLVRRKFIDGIISQYDADYLQSLLRYNNVLMQKNRLLKDADAYRKKDIIEAFNFQMEQYGNVLYQKRKEFVAEFEPEFTKYYKALSNDGQTFEFIYRSDLHEKSLDAILKESLHKDLAIQYCSSGLHKDDLQFNINGQNLKRGASQGQQKTFLLALRLAQYYHIKKKTQQKPILLLDDVFDKLDTERFENLVAIINSKEIGQTFITDTNFERLERSIKGKEKSYKIFKIDRA